MEEEGEGRGRGGGGEGGGGETAALPLDQIQAKTNSISIATQVLYTRSSDGKSVWRLFLQRMYIGSPVRVHAVSNSHQT